MNLLWFFNKTKETGRILRNDIQAKQLHLAFRRTELD
jgi:hypothetical protein